MARSNLKSFARKSHCLVTTQWVFIRSRHTSLTTFSLWMENWWIKNVQMLDKEKYKRAYIIFLSLVTAEVTKLLRPFPFGYGQEAVAMCLPDDAGEDLENRGRSVTIWSACLRHEHRHKCVPQWTFPLLPSPHWPRLGQDQPVCGVTSHFPLNLLLLL